MEQITLALSHLEKLSDTNPICFQSTILLSNEKEKITLMQKSVKYVDNNYTEHTFKWQKNLYNEKHNKHL